jgi:DNA-binding HxlR family transcriptional regulator
MNALPPARYNPLSPRCPSRRLLELLVDKWSVLVIAALSRGVHRNGALLREIGTISQKMLTQTLRELEYNGLVTRIDHNTVPPHVEYHLTPLGESLIEPIHMLGAWVQQHFSEVEQARRSIAHSANEQASS